METVIVTRHPALVEYLIEQGLCSKDTKVLSGNVMLFDVLGKHVIGVLPFYLAASAACVTSIDINIPAELRGTELTLEQVRQYAGGISTYSIKKIETPRSKPA